MTIYKHKDIATDIRVTGVDIGNIGAKFYTEDDYTSSISMHIRYNNLPFDLTTTNMRPRLDLYLQDGSIFPDEKLIVEDAVNGKVTYEISPKVIKHVGRAKAKFFLWTDGSEPSVHIANFEFDIVDSGTNSAIAKEINVNLIDDAIMRVVNNNPDRFRGTPLTYDMLTDAEKLALKGKDGKDGTNGKDGAKGDTGPQGIQGEKGDGLQIDGVVATVEQLPTGTTKLTYLVDTTLYFRQSGQSTWTKGANIAGVNGKNGTVVTIGLDGYLYLDGVKSNTLVDTTKYTHTHTIAQITGLQTELNKYALATHNHDTNYAKLTDFNAHVSDNVKHVTSVERSNWNGKLDPTTADNKYEVKGTAYSKSESDNKFEAKGTSYSKAESDAKYGSAQAIDAYTKSESDVRYAPSGTSYTKTESDNKYELKGVAYPKASTYTKTEVDSKISNATPNIDMTPYLKTADADTKYANKIHGHTIDDITNLQTTLDGKANTAALNAKADKVHTHAVSDITGLTETLNGKLTKAQADNYYAPIGSQTGGTTATAGNVINANKKFGFVGDGVTDNYQPFKDLVAFVNANEGQTIEWDSYYNGNPAVYRVDRYVTIANIDAAYASGSPTHMVWTCKNVELITHGAKFVNMPMAGFTKTKAFTNGDGSWHYAKEEPITLFNFSQCDGVKADFLYVDGENHKIKFASGFTSKDNDNPRWTDNKPLAEGRGHGIIFSGSKNVDIANIKSINQAVDGVAIGFYANYGTMEVTQTTSFNITNLTATGNGRLGVSGLGCHGGEITNLVAEYNGTNKNAAGQYIYFSPAGGIDIEPHHSPIAMDNISPSNYKVEDWNGSMAVKNARIRYNSGTQIACTSTLLTRNVVFERCVVRPPKNRNVDHQLIQSSLQNCTFKDLDVDGKLTDGNSSRVMLYGAGYVSESTGVITGQAANVWSQVQGGKWANVEFWVNTDGNQTYNEIPAGQYGLHNIVFRDVILENVRMTLRTIRRFIFDNVVFDFPADSNVSKMYMWNASMKDCVMINRKSGSITLDLGYNETQSNFENLRISSGSKFTWDSRTKKYKTGTVATESIDIWDYTRAMEYVLANSTGTGTTTTSTTQPTTTTTTTKATTTTTTTTQSGTTTTTTTNFPFTAPTWSYPTMTYPTDGGLFFKNVPLGYTVVVTFPNSTTEERTSDNTSGDVTVYFTTTIKAGDVLKAVMKSPSGQTSAQSTVTVVANPSSTTTTTSTTVGTSGNLIGALTNTAAITEGWGKRKNLNNILSFNWNSGHGGIDGTAGWSTAKDKIAFTNLAYDGTTTGSTNERYIYMKFENLKPSTIYTFAADVSYTATDDINMLGGTQYGVNSTPKRISFSFKTDASGNYGYKWESDVKYGTKADGTAIAPFQDASFVNKANLQINKTLTLDKIMLNEGNTAKPYTAS